MCHLNLIGLLSFPDCWRICLANQRQISCTTINREISLDLKPLERQRSMMIQRKGTVGEFNRQAFFFKKQTGFYHYLRRSAFNIFLHNRRNYLVDRSYSFYIFLYSNIDAWRLRPWELFYTAGSDQHLIRICMLAWDLKVLTFCKVVYLI